MTGDRAESGKKQQNKIKRKMLGRDAFNVCKYMR